MEGADNKQRSAERQKWPAALWQENQSNGLLSVPNPNLSGDWSIFDDVIEQKWYRNNKHGSGLFILEFWARLWYCVVSLPVFGCLLAVRFSLGAIL